MAEFTVVGLRVLREVVRSGSFSAAADRLGYTQSAVSRQIALLERAAGHPLFERRARGVRPTEAGQVVARHADIVLADLEAAQQDLRELDARPPGRLRVGAFPSAMAVLVPHTVAAFARREPRIQVRLREGTSPGLVNAVVRDRLDLAVVTGVTDPPGGIGVRPLLDDPLFVAVAVGHRLSAHSTATVDLLRGERWIVGSADRDTTLLGAWQDRVAPARHAYVVKDWAAKLGLVAAGLGITVVPGLAVPALPPAVTAVRIDHPEAVRPTVIVHRRDLPGGATAFLRMLTDQAAR